MLPATAALGINPRNSTRPVYSNARALMYRKPSPFQTVDPQASDAPADGSVPNSELVEMLALDSRACFEPVSFCISRTCRGTTNEQPVVAVVASMEPPKSFRSRVGFDRTLCEAGWGPLRSFPMLQ